MTQVRSTTIRLAVSPPAEGRLPLLGDGGIRRLTPADADLLGPNPAGPALMDRAASVLPYTAMDRYDRHPAHQDVPVATVTNEHLEATFLTGFGGRLWSLRDLRSGRELLHTPRVLQPGNLGLRNAWFAGGVEWNLGFTGHWPLTCAPVFAGRVTAPDGTPVLRLWAYERMLGLTWRLDAWLPPGAATLYVRPVLVQPVDPRGDDGADVPVYWWSNIAVPLTDDTRVLAPAARAWHFGYGDGLESVDVDEAVTRPATAPHSADYFYDLRDAPTPWICAVDAAGEGLVHASTPQLRGRKLFVWGEGGGGRQWQRWLGAEEKTSRGYVEIQAGLGRTQLEHFALPPGERWAWTEAYAPLSAAPAGTAPAAEAVHAVNDLVSPLAAALDDADRQLAAIVDRAPDEILATGSGWGALEEAVGHHAPDPATPYPADTLGPDQQPWLDLARTGRLDDPAAAPVLGRRWTERLAQAPLTAAGGYHLGLARWAAGEREEAIRHWKHAADLDTHPLVLRALGWTARQAGEPGRAADHYRRAIEGPLDDDTTADVAVEALRLFVDEGDARAAHELLDRLPADVRDRGRVRYLACRLALLTGDLNTARRMLVDDVLVVPDLREGDQSMDVLWAAYCRAAGVELPLPPHYDFRMRVEPDRPSASSADT